MLVLSPSMVLHLELGPLAVKIELLDMSSNSIFISSNVNYKQPQILINSTKIALKLVFQTFEMG